MKKKVELWKGLEGTSGTCPENESENFGEASTSISFGGRCAITHLLTIKVQVLLHYSSLPVPKTFEIFEIEL